MAPTNESRASSSPDSTRTGKPGGPLDGGDELVPVGRLADGRGGDYRDPLRARLHGVSRLGRHHLGRLVDLVLGDLRMLVEALADAGVDPLGHELPQLSIVVIGHQEADRVRADVDAGEGHGAPSLPEEATQPIPAMALSSAGRRSSTSTWPVDGRQTGLLHRHPGTGEVLHGAGEDGLVAHHQHVVESRLEVAGIEGTAAERRLDLRLEAEVRAGDRGRVGRADARAREAQVEADPERGQSPSGRVRLATALLGQLAARHRASRPPPRRVAAARSRGGLYGSEPSSLSRKCFFSAPPVYWPITPPLRTTRWQGTTIGSGFRPSAVPVARAARGLPAISASSP